jgi:hypothetical protein
VLDTRLLLHFDGNDTAKATFDSSPQAHTPITFNGQAQLDTALKPVLPVSNVSSLLLDGSTSSQDYVTVGGTETDWDICANNAENWTIDFWVRHADHSGVEYYVRNGGSGADIPRWYICHEDNGGTTDGLTFHAGTSSDTITLPAAGEISDTNWHWIAFVKVGIVYAMYKDGTQVNYVSDNSIVDASGVLYVGGFGSTPPSVDPLNGSIDELRIFYGNAFNAAPNSGLTNTITNIPEPATISLLGLGVLSLIRRKRSV